MRSSWRLVAFAGLLACIVSCSVGRLAIRLRAVDDATPAEDRTGGMRVFLVPEEAATARGNWGVLGADSLVVYQYTGRIRRPDGSKQSTYTRVAMHLAHGRLSIIGYTAADGIHAPLDGFVRRDGDSLSFWNTATKAEFRRAVGDVASLDAWTPSVTDRVMIYTLVGVVFGGMLLLAVFF